MKTIRGMTGMPVVCRGRRIGRVIQAELTEDLKQLKGLWVSAGLLGTRYIPGEALQMIGQVAILSDTRGARRRAAFAPLFMRAIATDGARVGAVTGAEIDEISLSVTALELSRGLWDDLLSHRAHVTRYTVNRETGEVIIDSAGLTKGGTEHEGRHDQGNDRGDADRFGGGDDVRRDELADRAEMEPEREEDRPLDL